MSDVTLHHGDCLDVLRELPDASVDAVVTDPPYLLGFMGREWDTKAAHEHLDWHTAWAREAFRVAKPGAHLLAFGGTRTSHRLACAIEDAGFEIRDSIAWLYGSGFPKSLDVSKAIDKAAGAEREVVGFGQPRSTPIHEGGQTVGIADPITAPATDDARTWQGWGTALKPAHEPIVVARKPLAGTVAANVLTHGTGALNVDGCRVDMNGETVRTTRNTALGVMNDDGWQPTPGAFESHTLGRWPANVVLDESQARELDQMSGEIAGVVGGMRQTSGQVTFTVGEDINTKEFTPNSERIKDTGGASRFFYVAKADSGERVRVNGTAHPTVKPLALMRWLVRLVTPPGGTVLEPFAGSGTTVEACILEGFDCIAIEREADYLPLIRQRINRRRDPVEAIKVTGDDGGLFDLLTTEEPA